MSACSDGFAICVSILINLQKYEVYAQLKCPREMLQNFPYLLMLIALQNEKQNKKLQEKYIYNIQLCMLILVNCTM